MGSDESGHDITLLFQVNGHMDYMKKMNTVLQAVGIKTHEVTVNHLLTGSDSGYMSKSSGLDTADDGK